MSAFVLQSAFARANRTTALHRGLYDASVTPARVLFLSRWDGGGAASNPECWVTTDRGLTHSENSVGAGTSSSVFGLVKAGALYTMCEGITPSVRDSPDGVTWTQRDTLMVNATAVDPFTHGQSGALYGADDGNASARIRRKNSLNNWTNLGNVDAATHRWPSAVPGTADVYVGAGGTVDLYRFTLDALTVVAGVARAWPDVACGPSLFPLTTSVFFASRVDAAGSVSRSLDGALTYAQVSLPAPFAGAQCHVAQGVRAGGRSFMLLVAGGGLAVGGRPAAMVSASDSETTFRLDTPALDPGAGWECIAAAVAVTSGVDAVLLWRNAGNFRLYALDAPIPLDSPAIIGTMLQTPMLSLGGRRVRRGE